LGSMGCPTISHTGILGSMGCPIVSYTGILCLMGHPRSGLLNWISPEDDYILKFFKELSHSRLIHS
jgi:hypothetical protein